MDFEYEANRIYLNDRNGELLAEITFPLVANQVVDINHTYVSDSLRGQGMAGKLMQAAAAVIEKNHWTARTSCSYADGWMKKHPEYQHLTGR